MLGVVLVIVPRLRVDQDRQPTPVEQEPRNDPSKLIRPELLQSATRISRDEPRARVVAAVDRSSGRFCDTFCDGSEPPRQAAIGETICYKAALARWYDV
jgi:hypothetical protein